MRSTLIRSRRMACVNSLMAYWKGCPRIRLNRKKAASDYSDLSNVLPCSIQPKQAVPNSNTSWRYLTRSLQRIRANTSWRLPIGVRCATLKRHVTEKDVSQWFEPADWNYCGISEFHKNGCGWEIIRLYNNSHL